MSSHSEIKGAVVGLYVPVNGTSTLVAARRDFELSESTDTRETTSTATGEWKEFRPGAQEWSASLTHMLLIDVTDGSLEASHQALRDAKRNRNFASLEVQYPGGTVDEGEGLVEELALDAPYDEVATVDVSIQGTGPIVRV